MKVFLNQHVKNFIILNLMIPFESGLKRHVNKSDFYQKLLMEDDIKLLNLSNY